VSNLVRYVMVECHKRFPAKDKYSFVLSRYMFLAYLMDKLIKFCSTLVLKDTKYFDYDLELPLSMKCTVC
jgi:hypothetical protein